MFCSKLEELILSIWGTKRRRRRKIKSRGLRSVSNLGIQGINDPLLPASIDREHTHPSPTPSSDLEKNQESELSWWGGLTTPRGSVAPTPIQTWPLRAYTSRSTTTTWARPSRLTSSHQISMSNTASLLPEKINLDVKQQDSTILAKAKAKVPTQNCHRLKKQVGHHQ